MYTLNIFKENKIPYSWATIYVGRKLQFLKPKEVEQYAVEYLEKLPTVTDPYVCELAFGTKEELIDQTLEKVLESIDYPKIKKDGPVWNLEKRKWRYCLLKNLEKMVDNHKFFLDNFAMLSADFGYPKDMNDFLYKTSSNENFNWEENIKDPFDELLTTEKSKIDNKDTTWPLSGIYYPLDN